MLLSVLDYSSEQAALDAASDGDIVYFPGVRTYQAPSGGWTVRKSLEIFGDGAGEPGSHKGTTLTPADVDQDVVVIEPQAGGIKSVVIRDLMITKRPGWVGSDGRYGIRSVCAPGKGIERLQLQRITVLNLRNHGFRLEGANLTDGTIAFLVLEDCSASFCDQLGFAFKNVRHGRIVRPAANQNLRGGIVCETSAVSLYVPAVDNNALTQTPLQGQVLADGCQLFVVDAGHFEKFQRVAPDKRQPPYAVACQIKNAAGPAVFGGSYFAIPGLGVDESTGILVESPGTGPIAVLVNRFTRVFPNVVDVQADVAGAMVLPQFYDQGGLADQTSIGVPGPPNKGLSGVSHLQRSVQAALLSGLLVPSFGSAPTTALQDGMLYYDTSINKLRVRIGAVWKSVKV